MREEPHAALHDLRRRVLRGARDEMARDEGKKGECGAGRRGTKWYSSLSLSLGSSCRLITNRDLPYSYVPGRERYLCEIAPARNRAPTYISSYYFSSLPAGGIFPFSRIYKSLFSYFRIFVSSVLCFIRARQDLVWSISLIITRRAYSYYFHILQSSSRIIIHNLFHGQTKREHTETQGESTGPRRCPRDQIRI
jgi:hypothetical protein